MNMQKFLLQHRTAKLLMLCTFAASSWAAQGQGLVSRSGVVYVPSQEKNFALQNIRTPELPATLYFAGERVPLENFDTRESLLRELMVNTYWHSQTMHIIKLANRWLPVIEPIMKANNLPDDFKYLCAAESAFQQLISPANAVGFWQILAGTGRDLGLEITTEIDERYHVEKSTAAAARYLHRGYRAFGSWAMAAAAYNMGEQGLRNQVVRQKTSSYYDLRLNDETSRYLFRILALKIIMSDPEKYGFFPNPDDLYPPFRFREVAVSTAVPSWVDFAAQHGTNYKILKTLNPWLRGASMENKAQKTYHIKIPEAGFRENAYK